MSIGVASLDAGDSAEDIYGIMRRADATLYLAKGAGRNRVRVAR